MEIGKSVAWEKQILPANDNLGTPELYGAVVAQLVDAGRLNDLGPGSPNLDAKPNLTRLAANELFSETVVDSSMANCCLSGLWLWNDFLDASHEISQDIPTPSGSYWHGIMHRREADFSNAKYWFQNVGDHPVFECLAQAALKRIETLSDPTVAAVVVRGGEWSPYEFVDLCQRCQGSQGELTNVCRQIARDEWWLLFDYCYWSATTTGH